MKKNLEDEIWRDVPDYEGLYQVSNLGRVRSLPKEWVSGIGGISKHNGKILKPGTTTNGYYKINLYKEGKRKTITVHKLVAMSFLGHKSDGHKIVVDHINNDKSNNRLDNLQLITQRGNTSKDRKGTSKYCGVGWHIRIKKWRVSIRIGYERIHLGYFNNEEKAGMYYQLALSNIDKYNGNPKEFRDYLNSI